MSHRLIAEILADRRSASEMYLARYAKADPDAGSKLRLTQDALRNEIRHAARSYTKEMHLQDILDLAIERTSGGPLRGLLVSLNARIKDPDDAHDAKYIADRMAQYAREIAADPVTTLVDC